MIKRIILLDEGTEHFILTKPREKQGMNNVTAIDFIGIPIN